MTRWLRSVRFFFSVQSMLQERSALVDRPWEEDLLHWAKDDTLHGCQLPPQDGQRHSVTSDGWCPCWARQQESPTVISTQELWQLLAADQVAEITEVTPAA